MSKEVEKQNNQIFDSLLADATSEVRNLFEQFLKQCLKVADNLQEQFGEADRKIAVQKKIDSDVESSEVPPFEGDRN